MQLLNEQQLDFNDVLILPKRSTLKSRKDVNVERTFKFKHTKHEWTGYPLIASNMLTGTFSMANKLAEYNAMTALHKHYDYKELANFYEIGWGMAQTVAMNNTFYSLGITNKDYDKYKKFCQYVTEGTLTQFKPIFVCIDVANGYMEQFVDFVRMFRKENPNTVIMAGNVVTGEMTEELIIAGADIVKVGIGSGQNCLTRRQAGIGRPQLSTVIDCADHAHGLSGLVCSDGGISQPADLNIAFAAGADFVMIGSMLSGTDECDGEIVEHNGKFHKQFFGMSSNSAMQTFGTGKEDYKASEGRTTLVPCKGSASHVVEELMGSTRSMLSYIGATKLKEASKRATLIRVGSRINNNYEKYTIGN